MKTSYCFGCKEEIVYHVNYITTPTKYGKVQKPYHGKKCFQARKKRNNDRLTKKIEERKLNNSTISELLIENDKLLSGITNPFGVK